MKYCPSCGKPNEDSSKFCVSCGTRFAPSAPSRNSGPVNGGYYTPRPAPQPGPQPVYPPSPEKPKKKLSGGAIAGIIAAAVIILLAVFLLVKPFGNTEKETYSTPLGDIEIIRLYKKDECVSLTVSDGRHKTEDFDTVNNDLEKDVTRACFEYDGITAEYKFSSRVLVSYSETSPTGTLERSYVNGVLTQEREFHTFTPSYIRVYDAGGNILSETELAADGFILRVVTYGDNTYQYTRYYREGENNAIAEEMTYTVNGDKVLELTRKEGEYPDITIQYYSNGKEAEYIDISYGSSWANIYTSMETGGKTLSKSYDETDYNDAISFYNLVSSLFAATGYDSLISIACDDYGFYLESEDEYSASTGNRLSGIQYNEDGSVDTKRFYDDRGNEIRTERYKNGELTETVIRTFDAAGKEISTSTVKSGINLYFDGTKKQIGSWIMPVIGANVKNCTSFTFCYQYNSNSGMLGRQELYASISGVWTKLGYFNCEELNKPGSFTYTQVTPFSVEGFVLIPEHRNESSFSVDIWLDDVYTTG